jgi:hypothetical protein
MVLRFPTEREGVDVCIAQPGVITNSTTWSRALVANLFRVTNLIGRPFANIPRSELAAAVLSQAVIGFEKDTLLNVDLVRLGQKALKSQKIPKA